MQSKLTAAEKKQLWIFIAVAFGMPIVMGILMGISFYRGNDVSAFPNAQMYYPAAGVMLAYILTRKKEEKLPMKFYVSFIILTGIMTVTAIISMILPEIPFVMIIQYIIIIGSLLLWIPFLMDKKEVRRNYGLSLGDGQKRRPWLYVLLFLVLYFLRIFLSYVIAGQPGEFLKLFQNSYVWINMMALPINFFLVFTAFFGEEYGWRGFLQPMLQKRFGKRAGVLLLGIMWGFWHLPINMFYYSPDTWLQSVVSQLLTCTGLAIFFGYAQMKTRNIWVPVIMHYLNNNLIAVVAGSADVISGQVIAWGDVLILLVLIAVLFAPFIFSKAYGKEAPQEQKITEEYTEL